MEGELSESGHQPTTSIRRRKRSPCSLSLPRTLSAALALGLLNQEPDSISFSISSYSLPEGRRTTPTLGGQSTPELSPSPLDSISISSRSLHPKRQSIDANKRVFELESTRSGYCLMADSRREDVNPTNFSSDETEARFTHLCKIFMDSKGILTNMSAIGSTMPEEMEHYWFDLSCTLSRDLVVQTWNTQLRVQIQRSWLLILRNWHRLVMIYNGYTVQMSCY